MFQFKQTCRTVFTIFHTPAVVKAVLYMSVIRLQLLP